MNEAIAVATISAVGAVLVAVIGVFGAKLLGRVKVVQGQLENDHATSDTPNLRDNIDRNHRDVLRVLMPMQRDVAWLMRRQAETDDRVDHLEDTQERNQHAGTTDQGRLSGTTRRELRERRSGRVAYVPPQPGPL